MHLVLPGSVLDRPFPSRWSHVLRFAQHSRRHGMRLLGTVAQSLVFFAVLWLLAAGPGFLSARDSLVPVETGRPAPQASR